VKTEQAGIRSLWAVLFGLILALRLLTPAGFMPAFDHGAVTIVACPDGGGGSAPVGHHHGQPNKLHQPCPYASASSLGALGADFGGLLDVLLVAAALLLGRAFLFIERHGARLRPPSRGPPLPA
jgi:hypothetical protein